MSFSSHWVSFTISQYCPAFDIISFSSILGAFAIFFAAINIFGGFFVTQRMLEMFKKKEKKGEAKNGK